MPEPDSEPKLKALAQDWRELSFVPEAADWLELENQGLFYNLSLG